MQATAAVRLKKNASPVSERSAVEKVAFFVERRPGEIAAFGEPIVDERLAFVRPDVDSNRAALILARKTLAIGMRHPATVADCGGLGKGQRDQQANAGVKSPRDYSRRRLRARSSAASSAGSLSLKIG